LIRFLNLKLIFKQSSKQVWRSNSFAVQSLLGHGSSCCSADVTEKWLIVVIINI